MCLNNIFMKNDFAIYMHEPIPKIFEDYLYQKFIYLNLRYIYIYTHAHTHCTYIYIYIWINYRIYRINFTLNYQGKIWTLTWKWEKRRYKTSDTLKKTKHRCQLHSLLEADEEFCLYNPAVLDLLLKRVRDDSLQLSLTRCLFSPIP